MYFTIFQASSYHVNSILELEQSWIHGHMNKQEKNIRHENSDSTAYRIVKMCLLSGKCKGSSILKLNEHRVRS